MLGLAACSGQQAPSPTDHQADAQTVGSGGPLSTKNMEAVKGLQVTCAGPRVIGAILEFTIPDIGLFVFVDHDKLAYLPWGMALTFQAE